MIHVALVLNFLQVTVVVPSAASLQNLNAIWGGSYDVLHAHARYSYSLSFMWQLPLPAASIMQLRVSTNRTDISLPRSLSVYLNRFHSIASLSPKIYVMTSCACSDGTFVLQCSPR